MQKAIREFHAKKSSGLQKQEVHRFWIEPLPCTGMVVGGGGDKEDGFGEGADEGGRRTSFIVDQPQMVVKTERMVRSSISGELEDAADVDGDDGGEGWPWYA